MGKTSSRPSSPIEASKPGYIVEISHDELAKLLGKDGYNVEEFAQGATLDIAAVYTAMRRIESLPALAVKLRATADLLDLPAPAVAGPGGVS